MNCSNLKGLEYLITDEKNSIIELVRKNKTRETKKLVKNKSGENIERGFGHG